MWRRAAVGGTLAVATVALLLPWYATETESGSDTCFLGHHEGTRAGIEGWSWWPVGTRCSLELRDGTRLVQIVPPWQGAADWSGVGAR